MIFEYLVIVLLLFIILVSLYAAFNLKNALKKQQKYTNILLGIINLKKFILSKKTLGEILDITFKAIQRLFPCETTVIYLLEKNLKNGLFLNVAELSSPVGQKFLSFDPYTAKGVLADSFRGKKLLKTDDFSSLAAEDIIEKNSSLKSMIICPLIAEDSIGLIVLAHNRAKYFTEQDSAMLNILANEVSFVIKNSMLFSLIKPPAQIDLLSDLYTHASFQEHLKSEMIRCKEKNLPISVLIINIDYFKKVNELFGHAQGDALIKHVGKIIREYAKNENFASRYNVDEFAIAMPNTGKVDAAVLGEKIRHSIEEYLFTLNGAPVHITISGGISTLKKDTISENDLIEKARLILNEAKRQGRNKIFVNE